MNRKKAFVFLLISPLLALIAASVGYLVIQGRAKTVSAVASGVQASRGGPNVLTQARAQAEPVLIEHKKVILKGRTLADILKRYGFSDLEVENLKTGIKPVYNAAKVVAGHELRLYADTSLQVQRLEYDIDENGYLSVKRRGGAFAAEIVPFPYEVRTALVTGTIEDTPIAAFNKSGEGAVLAMDFAEIFAWDVDFYLDPRRGDSFRLIVQKKYLGDKFVSYGAILAAEYVNGGKLFQAFRFAYPDTGKADYFDAAGGSLRKEFMKSPLKYGHITSRFTASRFHPIERVYKSHFAVDYAAGIGTPVWATAAGRVLFAGWNGSSGQMFRIRHKGGYETMYSHLSGLGTGIQKDAQVEAGQVIGYVGATGEATGPHLDYRITYHDSYINPLGYRFKPADPLRPEYLADFQKRVRSCLAVFDLPLILIRNFLSAA